MSPKMLKMENGVISENSFFDFETEKVQVITLEQLAKTYKENDVYGNPLSGIYHFDFINRIVTQAQAQGLTIEIYDMFAAHNKDKRSPGVSLLPQVEAQHGEKAIEAHILRRVFVNMRITNFDDADFTTNIAVSFTQKGIQVGYGNMVKVCHNQTMIGGGERYSATFGNDFKVSFDEMLQKINDWLKNIEYTIMNEREKIKNWQNIDVPAEIMFRLIGQLTALRIAHDTSFSEIRQSATYPLNSAQINTFTENLMLKYALSKRVSLWDIYDVATNLYKGDSMDIPNIIPQNLAMTKLLSEAFNV